MAGSSKQVRVTLQGALKAVLVAAGSGFILQHVVERLWPAAISIRPLSATVVGTAVFLLLAAAGSGRERLGFLSSKHLAVACLTVLAVLGVLGTVILQAAHPAAYEATYGVAAAIVRYLFLDDVFHSMAFASVMGMAATGLGLSFLRKKPIDARRAGILATHAGCLLVLAGAAVQSVAGIKGRLELREGETADTFLAGASGGMRPFPLGFSLRLEDFELESYEPEIRLRIFEVEGRKQKLVASFDPAEAMADPDLLSRFGARIMDYWPDHEMRYEVEPADDPTQGVPALGLALPEGSTAWLLDTGRMEDARTLVAGKALVTFFWRAEDAASFAGKEAVTDLSPHVVSAPGGPRRVEVGSTYPLAGHPERFRIEAFYNDLLLDPQTREASNRSPEPRNPALRVVLVDAQGQEQGSTWLFANHPSFHSADTSSPLAGLRYSYEPVAEGEESWVIIGETGRIRRLGSARAAPLPEAGGPPLSLAGVEVDVAGLIESASVRTIHTTRSERPLRPVVRIARAGDDERPLFLPEGHAAELAPGLHLVLARKEDSNKDFLSTVSVIEAGRVVRRHVLEVNHPLRHGGFTFYQADFDPDDLGWSGLQVVRDPGLAVVYAGFTACTIGILVAFYLAPLLGRRRRKEA